MKILNIYSVSIFHHAYWICQFFQLYDLVGWLPLVRNASSIISIEYQWKEGCCAHLSNFRGGGVHFATYFCFLSSIRYNISTAEYDGWDSAVNSSIQTERAPVFNGEAQQGRSFSQLSDVYERFGFSKQQATEVGYRGRVK